MSRIYFTDRNLGKQFPEILRAQGIWVERHADHFDGPEKDDVWLPAVGARGWVVLTHDQQIRWKVNERDAVMEHGVSMFVLIGKDPHPQLARYTVNSLGRIEAFLDRHDPPFIAKVHRPSPREVAKNPRAKGSVQMWLTHEEWQHGH